jgi:hypothetical protein
MSDTHIEGFICDLHGEISVREDLVRRLLNRGHKMYLLTRNVGTLMNLVGIGMILRGCSIQIPIAIMAISLLTTWLNDYLNHAGRILTEMEFISTLKVVLEEIQTTIKFTQIENEKVFISDHVMKIVEQRREVSPIPQLEITKRGVEVSKKKV